MNNKIQQIQCPVCKNAIFINIDELLKGQQFTCSNCAATISLSGSSKKVVEDTMKKFEQIKTTNSNN